MGRRLTLAEGLCDELTAKVRLGLVSTTACRELVRLPEPLRVLGAAVTSLLAAMRFPTLRAARLLSVLEVLPGDLQHQALKRVQARGLLRGDAEEVIVERDYGFASLNGLSGSVLKPFPDTCDHPIRFLHPAEVVRVLCVRSSRLEMPTRQVRPRHLLAQVLRAL